MTQTKTELEIATENIDKRRYGAFQQTWMIFSKEHKSSCERFLEFLENSLHFLETPTGVKMHNCACNNCERNNEKIADLKSAIGEYNKNEI